VGPRDQQEPLEVNGVKLSNLEAPKRYGLLDLAADAAITTNYEYMAVRRRVMWRGTGT